MGLGGRANLCLAVSLYGSGRDGFDGGPFVLGLFLEVTGEDFLGCDGMFDVVLWGGGFEGADVSDVSRVFRGGVAGEFAAGLLTLTSP